MSQTKLRIAVVMVAVAWGAAAQSVGPSTSTACYLLPSPGTPPGSVATISLLTTGDSVGGYRMVGIPDGMGAFLDSGGLTVMSNHELGRTQGIVRDHGSTGAFVSRWVLDPVTKAVTSGRDHNTAPTDVYSYNRVTNTWSAGTYAWERYCSGDLPPVSAFQFGGLGTPNRIFLDGEETRPPTTPLHGSAWAHIVSGPAANQTWELPSLGQCAFENVVASPYPQVKTIVMCLDDSDSVTAVPPATQPSEVYVYIGNKQAAGDDITRAGLTGGTLYGIRVHVGGVLVNGESNTNGLGTSSYVGSGTFEMVALGDASTFNGIAQQTSAIANDIFRMQRVEDGAWDPRPGHENDFYFVTTASLTTNSRLWRLRFTAVGAPELGGQIDIMLTGSEGHQMLDNICVDPLGRVLMEEDPGSANRLAKVWMYDTTNGRLTEVAQHNPALFGPGSPTLITINEEASGIFPAFEHLGVGWYLTCVQNHAVSSDPELVEGGQYLALFVDPTLGHEFSLWYDSPSGAGSVQMHLAYGTPGATYFSGVSLAAGNFPNGAFFGIDISFADVINQYFAGDPFTNVLNAQGKYDSAVFTNLSSLTLYGVALDSIFSTFPQISEPFSYTIP